MRVICASCGRGAGLLFLALFGALACSGAEPGDDTDTQQQSVSAEVSDCISAHPAAEPFDVGQVAIASPAPGSGTDMSGAAAPARPTKETFAAECRADERGTGCDESFISLEAARCIGQADQFEAGLEEWTLALLYNDSHHRVVWGIENVLVDDGPSDYSGKSLAVDAVNGKILGRTSWKAAH